MSDEVNVPIQEVPREEPFVKLPSLSEGLRRMILAGIGAAAITRDEFEVIIQKLVDRGEVAQKDGEKMLAEAQTRFFKNAPPVPATPSTGLLEQGFDDLLRRLNIPTRRDVEDLTSKIQKLSEEIEELRGKK